MNGFNIPMPQGLAGAPPWALGAFGDILGGAMQTQGTPNRAVGAGGGAAVGLQHTSPELMDLLASALGTWYNYDAQMELLDYQARRDDANRAQEYELTQQELDAALEAERIAAGASRAASAASAAATTEAARINAEAARYSADQALAGAHERSEAARYAADQALAGVRLDTETRMKIAAGNLRLEAQRVAAEEFGAPSDWIKQVGFLRGTGMTRADLTPQAIRTSGEALGPGPPDLGPTPQAIIGDAGPELATATPQGMDVTPLDTQEAYWLRGKGVPSMQYGGTVGRLGQVTGGYSSPYRAQQVTQQQANREFNYVDMPRQVAQAGELETARLAMTPQQQAAAQARQQASAQQGFQQQLLSGQTTAMPGGGGFLQTTGARPGTGMVLSPAQMQLRDRLLAQQQVQQQEVPPQWFLDWQAAQGGAGGGAAAPGAAPGATPGTAAGTTGTATTANEMPFLEKLRTGGYVPLYEAWGGERTIPEAGITTPIKMPHEYNYADFARWLPTEQSMMFATWLKLGMEPTTALEIMRRSAPRGSAGAAVGYG